jgi:hypothetical protein
MPAPYQLSTAAHLLPPSHPFPFLAHLRRSKLPPSDRPHRGSCTPIGTLHRRPCVAGPAPLRGLRAAGPAPTTGIRAANPASPPSLRNTGPVPLMGLCAVVLALIWVARDQDPHHGKLAVWNRTPARSAAAPSLSLWWVEEYPGGAMSYHYDSSLPLIILPLNFLLFSAD